MKVPEPRKLPSGAWRIQLRLGGESISITSSSKKECKRQAELVKAEYRSGKRESRVSLGELTIRQGIDGYIEARKNKLSPSTVRGYRTIQKNRFQKYMDIPIMQIKDWQAVYDSEVDRLNPKTLKNSFALIKSVYLFYTKKPLPKVEIIPVVANERPYLDAEQIRVFLDAVKGQRCEIGALLALSSLRCSEAFGLDWDDGCIDLDHDRIEVRGAAVFDENNKFVHKDTNKNETSRRPVPIAISQLHAALEAVDNKHGPVICYKTPGGLWKAVNRVCKKAGLPQVGLHGLRHSFASLAVHLGIPEETTMVIGGWSDFTTMRKIYTHISNRDMKNHTDAFKSFYGNAHESAHAS